MNYKIFLFAIGILFYSCNAYACDCAEKAALQEGIENANFIYSGKVISKTQINILRSEPNWILEPDSIEFKELMDLQGWAIFRYEVEVEKVYKGRIKKDKVILYSDLTEGMCAYSFVVGEKYIIYANDRIVKNSSHKKKKISWTSKCSRTDRHSAEEDATLTNIFHR